MGAAKRKDKNIISEADVTPRERVAILDFGSQVTQLIARRIRELGVYSEIVRYDTKAADLKKAGDVAVILSGGPASVVEEGSPLCDPAIFDLGIPVLGICYGMQLMAHLLGGKLNRAEEREYGLANLQIERKGGIFNGLPGSTRVWMSHGDSVAVPPKGFRRLATTTALPMAAMADEKRKLYGVQFHPEVVHTPRGKDMLSNFVFRIAKCKGKWSMRSFIDTTIQDIRERVGEDDRVLCATSGGVDSSVLSALLHKAIGDRLTCIFINNGLLRKDEAKQVRESYKREMGVTVDYVNASDLFLRKLKGVTSPEKKRRIIGNTFIRVFENETKRLGQFRYLAQGTLYPDVIESLSPLGGPSSTIKTHHNVGGLPERMDFELVEPFRFLFKDEVREIGEELGLSEEIIWRHPFPGPGLAVRVLGEITRPRLKTLREADAIMQEELKRHGQYRETWQALAVFLPVKAVGVMGDERTYKNVIAIRVVTSKDGMTADWAQLPHDVLGVMARRIINEVKGVNRVVYDISSKPPATIEWE